MNTCSKELRLFKQGRKGFHRNVFTDCWAARTKPDLLRPSCGQAPRCWPEIHTTTLHKKCQTIRSSLPPPGAWRGTCCDPATRIGAQGWHEAHERCPEADWGYSFSALSDIQLFTFFEVLEMISRPQAALRHSIPRQWFKWTPTQHSLAYWRLWKAHSKRREKDYNFQLLTENNTQQTRK